MIRRFPTLPSGAFVCALGQLVFGLALLSSCKSSAERGSGATASASASAPSLPPRSYPVPTGPALAILAGKGVGPIRIGANTATIERLMSAPCEDKTPTLCRYITRGVEFELGADGNTVRIRAHRRDRDAGGGKKYGIFNGAIPPDARFGMLPAAVVEVLGPPQSVEEGDKGAYPGTAAQHRYPGMVLEYDQLPNGKPALGGVRIPD